MTPSIFDRCARKFQVALLKVLGATAYGRERERDAQRLQRAANVFIHAREGMMITDAKGDIVDVNATFTEITGYTLDDVVGRNPSILSSGRHDAAFYGALWSQLKAQDYWRGEIWDRRKDGALYPEMLTISAVRDGDHQVTHYVALFSDISQRKAMEERVWQLAFYDPLTHLPNRRLLSDRLAQALSQSERNAQWGAVLFLDLDNFKSLNDAQGHGAGDLLLIEVAQRLKGAVRGIDTVARMGGDEFVVLLAELGADRDAACAQACRVAEKIRLSLAETYRLRVPQHDAAAASQVEHHCSASVGVAVFGPEDASADQLLQSADAAMYQAKSQGRNRVQLHRG